MKKDDNKSGDYTYNFLNLPATASRFYQNNTQVISYDYTVSGRKVKESNIENGSTSIARYYAGPFTFINATNIEPAWVSTPYGRFVKNGTTWTHEFHMKDHLGNTRLALLPTGSTTQENNYYPFGMRISTLSSDPINLLTKRNRYTYNGKEFNNDYGLNWHDYGARMYDAQIGRWHAIDPSGENYFPISSYAYVGNNPIIKVDPDGRDWYEVKGEGKMLWNPSLTQDNYNQFFAEQNIVGIYRGETNFSFNEQGYGVHHNADGTETTGLYQLNEFVVEAKMGASARNQMHAGNLGIYDAQRSFLRGSAELSASILNNTGDGMQYIGTGLMAIPGGQPYGAGLTACGGIISDAGTVISLGLNLIDGDRGQFINNLVKLGISSGVKEGIGRVNKITNEQAEFLAGFSDSQISIFSTIVSFGLDTKE